MVENQAKSAYFQKAGGAPGHEGWFSNGAVRGYAYGLAASMGKLKGKAEIERAQNELLDVYALYSTLVYVLYPNSAKFRKAIDSSKERSANFAAIKGWLSENNGEEMARRVVKIVEKAVNA